MPAIGITGGIATGKSAFCDCLREILPTAKFFNADIAAREVVDLADVGQELRREFGEEIFSAGGELNRAQLRAIVFASADCRSALEKILHPRIRRRWSAEAQSHRQSPNDYFFADIPLLYETAGETLCDRVVVVACARAIQLERLLARMQIKRDEAEQIINSQMSLPEKMSRADHVVWNDGGRDVLKAQAQLLVDLWQTQKWTTK